MGLAGFATWLLREREIGLPLFLLHGPWLLPYLFLGELVLRPLLVSSTSTSILMGMIDAIAMLLLLTPYGIYAWVIASAKKPAKMVLCVVAFHFVGVAINALSLYAIPMPLLSFLFTCLGLAVLVLFLRFLYVRSASAAVAATTRIVALRDMVEKAMLHLTDAIAEAEQLLGRGVTQTQQVEKVRAMMNEGLRLREKLGRLRETLSAFRKASDGVQKNKDVERQVENEINRARFLIISIRRTVRENAAKNLD